MALAEPEGKYLTDILFKKGLATERNKPRDDVIEMVSSKRPNESSPTIITTPQEGSFSLAHSTGAGWLKYSK